MGDVVVMSGYETGIISVMLHKLITEIVKFTLDVVRSINGSVQRLITVETSETR